MTEILPNNQTAERALVGSVIMGIENVNQIQLDPEEFYTERHGWVWDAAREITRRGETADYVTIAAELKSRDQLSKCGGDAWLIGLISDAQSVANASSYAAIIHSLYRRRCIIRACGALASSAYDQDSNLQDAVSKAIDLFTKQVIEVRGAVHISEILGELWDQIEAAKSNPQDTFGIPTGFPDWDKITHGLQYGTVCLLTGEPGIGKSLLGAQFVTNAAEKGFPMAYYSLEMSALQVARRTLSRLSKISVSAMRMGRVNDNDWPALVSAFERMEQLPVYIARETRMKTTDLRVDLQRLKDKGVRGAVIDYEALFTDDEGKDEIERSTVISKRVHSIAVDLDIAILSIGDMTKAGMNGTVRGQTAAAGSGKTLHDRDEIMIMRANTDQRFVDITWEKQREGEGQRFMRLQKAEGFPAFLSVEPQKSAQTPGGKK